MCTVIGVTGYMVQPRKHATSTPAPPTAVLDGTYRLDYDYAKQTANGAPFPQPNTDNLTPAWWAFRSLCSSTGCTSTATRLDDTDNELASTPADTNVFHFADSRWQSVPDQRQVQRQQCLGANGTVTAGEDTEMLTWSLQPQLDGTLRGVWTHTYLTNECGSQGAVRQTPLVATRTADVPPGVTVADPATVSASPPTSSPAPAVAGPVLDGTYRLDYDYANQTVNGTPTTGGSHVTPWWAFRSLCTSTGCVATGAELGETNHQEAKGGADVLRFADGHWQDTPYLQAGKQCPGTNQTATYTQTVSWSWEPQPDGTLRGVDTETILTSQCGDQGNVVRNPFVATRTADVPSGVTVADPALF